MTEDVLISVRGLHSPEAEQEDEIEVISSGKYYFRNGKHFVLYEETIEEDGTVIKNRLKLSENALEIQKKGPVTANMTFLRGDKSTSWYGTPFGEMMVGIEVTEMEITEQESQIDVNIRYALEMNYEHVSDSSIHVKIMEKEKGLLHLN